MTVITGEEEIRRARILTLNHALKLELKGFKRRGRSVYSIVKEEFGFRGSRASVSRQLDEWVKTHIF